MLGETLELIKLSRRRSWTEERLRAHQNRLLGDTVRHAYERVAYYRNLLDRAGVDPAQIRDLDDLQRIPVSRSLDLRRHPTPYLLDARARAGRCDRSQSGGSSAVPFTVYYSRADRWRRRAVAYRARADVGGRWFDRELYVGTITPLVQHWTMSVTRPSFWWFKRSCAVSGDIDRARSFDPHIVRGLVSQLFVFARHLEEAGATADVRPRLVITGGETLAPRVRRYLEQVLGAPVALFYGAQEFGVIARPCSAGEGLHLVSDGLLVECLGPDGEHLEAGERGELVFTSLTARVMPFVRYAIGDTGRLGPRRCDCAHPYQRIDAVEGRTQDLLPLRNGDIVSGFIATRTLYWDDDILQYSIVQEAIDRFRILYVADAPLPATSLTRIRRHFEQHLLATEVEIERTDSIPRHPSGKARVVMSHVPLPES